jgi:hypothetical protein
MPLTRLALHCMVSQFPDYIIAQAIRVSAPHFSNATLGRSTLSPAVLMNLSYLFDCEPDQLVGWANDGIDTNTLSSELPCLETGVDTDIPRKRPLNGHYVW